MIHFLSFTFHLKINGKIFLFFTFKSFSKQKLHSKKKLITCRVNNSTDSNIVEVRCRSGFPINQAKDDSEKDCEVSPELARLIEHEGKEIQPH